MKPEAKSVRRMIILLVAAILLLIFGLYLRAVSRTNQVALSQSPRPVSVDKALSAHFRPLRKYVGTTNAWNTAKVGPQFVSAYLGSVLVRPGAVVRKGQVLATLDCRNTSAASREIAARAKAHEERQAAVEHEAQRTRELTAGGFASANEVEQLNARSSSQKSEVEGLRAQLAGHGLEVDDCILRAPFDGEVADRFADPGAYVRPGNPVITVIDRSIIRITADAPECDFAVVAPDIAVTVEASGIKSLEAKVSRRAPQADESTRTIHFEVDLPNRDHLFPVGTTATLTIAVGEPEVATSIPIQAATIHGDRATVFVVDGGIAKRKTFTVLGEDAGLVYLDAKLAAGSLVVVEGRALLEDQDQVTAKVRQP